MSENWQLDDKDYEKLGVELGPIGWGVYYLCTWTINHRI
jgi:hypothetical protein